MSAVYWDQSSWMNQTTSGVVARSSTAWFCPGWLKLIDRLLVRTFRTRNPVHEDKWPLLANTLTSRSIWDVSQRQHQTHKNFQTYVHVKHQQACTLQDAVTLGRTVPAASVSALFGFSLDVNPRSLFLPSVRTPGRAGTSRMCALRQSPTVPQRAEQTPFLLGHQSSCHSNLCATSASVAVYFQGRVSPCPSCKLLCPEDVSLLKLLNGMRSEADSVDSSGSWTETFGLFLTF